MMLVLTRTHRRMILEQCRRGSGMPRLFITARTKRDTNRMMAAKQIGVLLGGREGYVYTKNSIALLDRVL